MLGCTIYAHMDINLDAIDLLTTYHVYLTCLIYFAVIICDVCKLETYPSECYTFKKYKTLQLPS
jgi:hypothetical protein